MCSTAAVRRTTSRLWRRSGLLLTDGKKEGAVDFLIGGDLNIEFSLENADEDLHGLCSDQSVEQAARTQSPVRKLRWLQ